MSQWAKPAAQAWLCSSSLGLTPLEHQLFPLLAGLLQVTLLHVAVAADLLGILAICTARAWLSALKDFSTSSMLAVSFDERALGLARFGVAEDVQGGATQALESWPAGRRP